MPGVPILWESGLQNVWIWKNGGLEPGKWSLERNILKPAPPRVRNAPSCAGQARGGRGPNILIDRCWRSYKQKDKEAVFHKIMLNLMLNLMSYNRKNGAWANAWGSKFVRVGIGRSLDLEHGSLEPGKWSLKRNILKPGPPGYVVPRAVRVRPRGGVGPIY